MNILDEDNSMRLATLLGMLSYGVLLFGYSNPTWNAQLRQRMTLVDINLNGLDAERVS